jgi:hypothetical protein
VWRLFCVNITALSVADWRSHFDRISLRHSTDRNRITGSATLNRNTLGVRLFCVNITALSVADWRSHFDRISLRHSTDRNRITGSVTLNRNTLGVRNFLCQYHRIIRSGLAKPFRPHQPKAQHRP